MRVALGDRQSGLVGLGGFESLSEAVTSLLRRALAALADRPALPRGDR
jgi:Arc/MetJ-type ribon-helix-helix transcriptional regulator